MAKKFVQGIYTPDRLITPHLVALGGCIESKLEEAGIATCYGGVISGDGADLSEIGVAGGAMWWVRLAAITPDATVPSGRCTPVLSVAVGLGFATCYPINANGEALNPQQQLTLSDLVNTAMMALLRAFTCCEGWHDAKSGLGEVALGAWTPVGPMGGALGGEWGGAIQILRRRPEPEPETP